MTQIQRYVAVMVERRIPMPLIELHGAVINPGQGFVIRTRTGMDIVTFNAEC